jgi:hypothetical protein
MAFAQGTARQQPHHPVLLRYGGVEQARQGRAAVADEPDTAPC